MASQKKVVCPENEDLASFLWSKWEELILNGKNKNKTNGISENLDAVLYRAYSNICSCKTPIMNIKDLSKIKGIGKWTMRLVGAYFQTDTVEDCGSEDRAEESNPSPSKKKGGSRRYVPQKSSASYALLVALHRGTTDGKSFMRKQELIDAAESSGLSRVSIGPEKSSARPGQFPSSGREWYCGWNSMKTLIAKGLIAKSSSPAKYMLTNEGQESARECLSRSGLLISDSISRESDASPSTSFTKQTTKQKAGKRKEMQSGLSETNKEISATLDSVSSYKIGDLDVSYDRQSQLGAAAGGSLADSTSLDNTVNRSFTLTACSSSKLVDNAFPQACQPELAMPPGNPGERFEDLYEVILVLDDREHFVRKSSRATKVVESLNSQFSIKVEVRRLPVGDGIWVARQRHTHMEYVLDFIVERKNIDDLRCSIRDSRYKDQKMRLVRCGLQKLIYLVEGDPNSSEAAESIKTACFTTELLEGFDVQRTSGLFDTVRKYGYLTKSISNYYSQNFPTASKTRMCSSYSEFLSKCEDLDKMTVSDVFAVQLMQVAQVTEDVALAVLDLYPTLLSLASAYARNDGGDKRSQEEMLNRQNKLIGFPASKNIYNFVWGT